MEGLFSEVHQGKFSGITYLSNTHLATNIYDVAFCRLDRTYAVGPGVRYEERWRSSAASAPASAEGDRKPMWPSGRIRTRPPVGMPARTGSSWREMPEDYGKWETAYRRQELWVKQGLWQRILRRLGEEDLPGPATKEPN